MTNTKMAVMEVLLVTGLWMVAAGSLVQVGNINQLVGFRTRHDSESTNGQVPHFPLELCPLFPYYQDLSQLLVMPSCLPAIMVWQKLSLLSLDCRDTILDRLSEHFGHVSNNPSYCHCDWDFLLPRFDPQDDDHHETCMDDDHEYNHLYNTYIWNSHHGRGLCATHHHVWQHLHNVHHTGDLHFCRENLVNNLFNAYIHHTGYNCTMVPSTTTVAPATTTTTRLTTVLALPSCDKYATISSVAFGTPFQHPTAASCGTTKNHRASEALVFNLCQAINDTSLWKEGPNVMNNCQNIPLYTPIATFYNGAYSSNGGLSGVFLGCLPDGIKIAAQECGSNSTILNLVHGGILTRDPNIYSVITL